MKTIQKLINEKLNSIDFKKVSKMLAVAGVKWPPTFEYEGFTYDDDMYDPQPNWIAPTPKMIREFTMQVMLHTLAYSQIDRLMTFNVDVRACKGGEQVEWDISFFVYSENLKK
jgi:hypothetical protein